MTYRTRQWLWYAFECMGVGFGIFIISAMIVLFLANLSGCAVGFTHDTKQPVLGLPVGPQGQFPEASSMEKIGQAVGTTIEASKDWLPPPWNGVAGVVLSVLGAGGLYSAAKKRGEEVGWNDRETEQVARDLLFEEGVNRGATGSVPVSAGTVSRPPPIVSQTPGVAPDGSGVPSVAGVPVPGAAGSAAQ